MEFNLLTPPVYYHLSKPCLAGRGGGLASVFKNNYKIGNTDFHAVVSFEYLSFRIAGPTPLLILLIYRPVVTSNVLEALAPLKSRTVPSAHSSPWFTPELRLMKAKGRHFLVHATLYSNFISQYKKALNTAQSSYLSTIINREKCKPKTLFSEINKLVKTPTPLLNGSSDLCDDLTFFYTQNW